MSKLSTYYEDDNVEIYGRKWNHFYNGCYWKPMKYCRYVKYKKSSKWFELGIVGDTNEITDTRMVSVLEKQSKGLRT